MPFFPFCFCLCLILLLLLIDLRTKRVLDKNQQTQSSKTSLKLWPLQVLMHLILLYLVSSTPVLHQRPRPIQTSFRAVPGPLIPSIPPMTTEWKKKRIERL